MTRLARRVARRAFRKQAGVLQAPPAMVKEIRAWVLAVIAGRRVEELIDDIEDRAAFSKSKESEAQEKLSITRDWVEDPTNYSLYKRFYEEVDPYFLPIQKKISIRKFQKMDDSKREFLSEESKRQYELVERWYKERGVGVPLREFARNLYDEIERLEEYMDPSVKFGMGQRVNAEFKIDLTGWRYGEEDVLLAIEESADAAVSQKAEAFDKMKEKYPDMYEEVMDGVKTELKGFTRKTIDVSLMFDRDQHFRGSWNPHKFELQLVAPYTAAPWALEDLGRTLRHELQHLSQTLLSASVGTFHTQMFEVFEREPRPGMPSKAIMTPEFVQQYDNAIRQNRVNDFPELKTVIRDLKRQGVDPRMIKFHALDDIEFYTRLADAIHRFKKAQAKAGKMTREELNTAIKIFTYQLNPYHYEDIVALGPYEILKGFHHNQSDFFRILSKVPSARGKYQKALKMLYKAVT